uniref:Uncharacterized protein n=1 Tax=Aegilops tauschii TaxID=37682 RepID=M8AUU3_AEGTA
MPATMPLTLSLPRLLLLHRRRHAKVQQPRPLARLRCAPDEVAATTAEQRQGEGEEEELVLLASYRTAFNEDECVSLPTVVPRGPVALLGLGAGTAAHMMLEVWPWIQLIGWEIDPTVIELSRDYFGIVVDLFADGEVLPQLQEVDTWLEIAKKLMPDGRIMVNCGAGDAAVSLAADADVSSWVQNPTIKALCSAFPGQLNWKRLSEKESVNYVALTGPLPDLEEWSASVPSELSLRVKQWVPCKLA